MEAESEGKKCRKIQKIVDTIFWEGQELEGVVKLPDNVRIVAGGAFYGNTKITEVHLPQCVRFIGCAAWKGCQNLQKAVLPAGYQRIAAEVFSGCVALEEVIQYSDESGKRKTRFRRGRQLGSVRFINAKNCAISVWIVWSLLEKKHLRDVSCYSHAQ